MSQIKENPRKNLDFNLDQNEFDYLIMGTGLTEQLYCAHMQKIAKKKCLIIDLDDQYSSSIRTVNFKEFHSFLQKLNPNQAIKIKKQVEISEEKEEKQENEENNKQSEKVETKDDKVQNEEEEKKEEIIIEYDMGKLNKQFQFYPAYISKVTAEQNNQYSEEIIDSTKHLFRRFNIDLQPKILFSSSLTVDMMRQADMDKYMEFKAVQGIYFFDLQKNKFLPAPSGKSDIFKHKDLSLKEKKDMFNILHKCVKLYYSTINHEADQNSIEEFDKDFKIDEQTINNFEQYKNEVCTVFLKSVGCSQKVMEMFMYTICNFELNVINWETSHFKEIIKKEFTTVKFLAQVAKFIKSCGVHTKFPYLYTAYGTGDIPQGFSRIGAVYGGQFIISKQISVYGMELQNREMNIDTNLVMESQREKEQRLKRESESVQGDEKQQQQQQQEVKKLKIKEGIIVGHEYIPSLTQQGLLQAEQFELCSDRKDSEKKEVTINMLRLNYFCKIKKQEGEEEKEEDLQLKENAFPPILYYVPPNHAEIKNEHPITIFQLDSDTSSTPKGYYIFQVKTVISDQMVDENNAHGPEIYNESNEQCTTALSTLIDKLKVFIENITIYSEKGYSVLYTGCFLQKRSVVIEGSSPYLLKEKSSEVKGFKIALTEQENFEIDMDRNYDEFRKHVGLLSDAYCEKKFNFFMTEQELKGEDDGTNYCSDDDEDGLTKLINKFDTLKQGKPETNNNDNNIQAENNNNIEQVEPINENSKNENQNDTEKATQQQPENNQNTEENEKDQSSEVIENGDQQQQNQQKIEENK